MLVPCQPDLMEARVAGRCCAVQAVAEQPVTVAIWTGEDFQR